MTSYGSSVAFPLVCTLAKVSLCLTYMNVFSIRPYVRRGAQILIGFLIINSIAWLVPTVIVCQPISAYWSVDGPRKCIDYNVFGTWISFPNIVTDLVMFVLPLPVLWGLQMSRPKKVGLTITFFAGTRFVKIPSQTSISMKQSLRSGIIAGVLWFSLYIHRTYINHARTNESIRK